MNDATTDRVRPVGLSIIIMVLAVLILCTVRVVQLQVNPPQQLAHYDGSVTVKSKAIGRRGTIVDRAGRVLAVTRLGYRLFADPKELRISPDELAWKLQKSIGLDARKLTLKLLNARHGSRYVVLSKLLPDKYVKDIRALKIHGLGLEKYQVRDYPAGDTAAALIGKVGFFHEGRLGAELSFDAKLIGRPGETVYVRDALRRPLWVKPGDFTSPTPGSTVQLSIDLVIQQIVEEELHSAVLNANAGGGRAVVVDPDSGEVLAMADILNTPVRDESWIPFTTDPERQKHPALGRLRCVTDVYEPGSTFKAFMWSVMTELGKADVDEILDCRQGAWKVPYGRRVLHDAFPKDKLTWHDVLVHSSNIGMGQVAERMSPEQMQQAVLRFGFGSKTNLGLPGEVSGIVTPPDKWSRYTQTSVAMGQEIAVTPVQLVRAFCAFARVGRKEGTLPYLRITSVQKGEVPPPLLRVLHPDTVRKARYAMSEVGNRLDAKLKRRGLHVGSHKIFGKSGTAQLPNSKDGGYYNDRYISSFIAAAPLDNPRLVILVIIDDPDKKCKIGHYGSSVAGPAVRNIIDRTLAYMGYPDKNQKLSVPETNSHNTTGILALR